MKIWNYGERRRERRRRERERERERKILNNLFGTILSLSFFLLDLSF